MALFKQGTTWSAIAVLLVISSCTADGQTRAGSQAAVADQTVRAAVELLNRVDEVLSVKRGTEIVKQQTAALERLPKAECEGLTSAKFRLETAGMTSPSLIDAGLATSKARRLLAERRGSEDLESWGPVDLQAGRTVGEIVGFVSAAFKGQLAAAADQEYVSKLVEAERVANDCKTPEYVRAETANEMIANQQVAALLVSEAPRLRALIQNPEVGGIVTAQADFNAKLGEQRRRNPDAAKAMARVDALRKSAETPALLKSRSDLQAAIRAFR